MFDGAHLALIRDHVMAAMVFSVHNNTEAGDGCDGLCRIE